MEEEGIIKKLKEISHPSIKHYRDETVSIWQIRAGNRSIFMGDAGMKEFNKALKEDFEKFAGVDPPPDTR